VRGGQAHPGQSVLRFEPRQHSDDCLGSDSLARMFLAGARVDGKMAEAELGAGATDGSRGARLAVQAGDDASAAG